MLIGMKDSEDDTSGRVTAACVGQEVGQESEVLQVLPPLARTAEGWSCRVGFMDRAAPGGLLDSPTLSLISQESSVSPPALPSCPSLPSASLIPFH